MEGKRKYNIQPQKPCGYSCWKFFSEEDQRDFYQIVYDSFIPDRIFTGEVYDDSDKYIEKVINIYLYGCAAIFQSLKNVHLLCNFTDKDIESLSRIVKYHYYSIEDVTSDLVTKQMKSIAEVFDIKNKSSIVSHYLAFK